jgi:hypothetical protein
VRAPSGSIAERRSAYGSRTENPTGNYSVTVPYPGVYRIGDSEVRVTEAAVRNGTRTTA